MTKDKLKIANELESEIRYTEGRLDKYIETKIGIEYKGSKDKYNYPETNRNEAFIELSINNNTLRINKERIVKFIETEIETTEKQLIKYKNDFNKL